MTTLNAGGLENYVLRFLAFDNKENDIHILCKSGHGGVLEERYFDAIGKDKVIFHKVGYFNLPGMIGLGRIIRNGKFDAVCDFTGNFAGIPMLLSKWAKVRNRITFYRNSANHFSDRWYNRLYDNAVKKLSFKCSTRILSNSQAAFDQYYPGVESEKFRVIYNGINADFPSSVPKETIRQKLGIPQNAFVIGHTGRYDAAKNHDMIFKVASDITSTHDDIWFLIIGKGVPVVAARYGLSDHIVVLDYRTDIADLLRAMDLYYFPSLWEGQPNAMIEAMVSGLAVIASDIPAVQESVPDNMRGNLVDPNDFERNREALLRCWASPDFLESNKCMMWSRSYFDADRRFSEFKEELSR